MKVFNKSIPSEYRMKALLQRNIVSNDPRESPEKKSRINLFYFFPSTNLSKQMYSNIDAAMQKSPIAT